MSSWSLAFPQQPGHVGEVQDLGVLGQKAGESIGIENCDIQLNRASGPGSWCLLLLLPLSQAVTEKKQTKTLQDNVSIFFSKTNNHSNTMTVLAWDVALSEDQSGLQAAPITFGSVVQTSFYRGTDSLSPANDGPSLALSYACTH